MPSLCPIKLGLTFLNSIHFKLSVEDRLSLLDSKQLRSLYTPPKSLEMLKCLMVTFLIYQFSNILSQTRLISIVSKPIEVVAKLSQVPA